MPERTEHEEAYWVSPPEWVPLREVTDWVRRIHEVEPDKPLVRDLIAAVREGRLIHRVGGIPQGGVFRGYPKGLGTPRSTSADRIVVLDWEAADPDWQSGTVAGWPSGDGQRGRLLIEIYWVKLDNWLVHDVARLRRKPKTTAPTPAPKPQARTAPPPIQRGRPPRFDWEEVAIRLGAHVYANGPPDPDGGQAQLESMVAEMFEPDNMPSESLIRQKVSRLLAAFEQAANPKAGN